MEISCEQFESLLKKIPSGNGNFSSEGEKKRFFAHMDECPKHSTKSIEPTNPGNALIVKKSFIAGWLFEYLAVADNKRPNQLNAIDACQFMGQALKLAEKVLKRKDNN